MQHELTVQVSISKATGQFFTVLHCDSLWLEHPKSEIICRKLIVHLQFDFIYYIFNMHSVHIGKSHHLLVCLKKRKRERGKIRCIEYIFSSKKQILNINKSKIHM